MNITEIARMKTVEGITKDEFIGIVDELERNFHSKQKDFIDTELLYHDEENEWYMIQQRLGGLRCFIVMIILLRLGPAYKPGTPCSSPAA